MATSRPFSLDLVSRRREIMAAFAALAVVFSMPAAAETLRDALVAAYLNNPTLLAQQARLRVVDEQVPRALSNWRPTVTVTGDSSTLMDESRSQNSRTPPTTSSREPASLALAIRQPLYRGGRTTAEANRGENLVLRERAQLQVVEQSVLLDVVTAYVNVLRDQAVLDLNLNNEQVLTRQLQAARDRFQVGEITRTSVAQAEARLAGATADRFQAEGNLASSRATYRRVVGDFPGRLEPAEKPADLPATPADVIAATLAGNANIRVSLYAEIASRFDVELVQGEFLPTVNLTGDFSRNHESGAGGTITQSSRVGANFTVPLYTNGNVDARVRESKQTNSQRRLELEDSRRRAQESAILSFETVETARARLNALETQIQSAEIALEGVDQEARVGSQTVLDVLNAEQDLLNARVNQVRSQRDEIVASYQLATNIGKMTARDLALPVEYYDPTLNYNNVRNRFIGTRLLGE